MGRNSSEFDCAKCALKHCDEDRKRPGSRGPSGISNKWEIVGVITSRTCLLPMITDDSREWLALYTHYKNRVLPFAGGLYDQPAAWKQAMEIIESHVSR